MTCKDCIHYDLCRSFSRIQLGWHGNSVHYVENMEEICKDFKDRSQFVELPVKPGTVLFVPIRNQITKYKIKGICVREHGFGSERVLIEGISCSPFYSDISAIGKTAFLTREEAEQALKLKERENDA